MFERLRAAHNPICCQSSVCFQVFTSGGYTGMSMLTDTSVCPPLCVWAGGTISCPCSAPHSSVASEHPLGQSLWISQKTAPWAFR